MKVCIAFLIAIVVVTCLVSSGYAQEKYSSSLVPKDISAMPQPTPKPRYPNTRLPLDLPSPFDFFIPDSDLENRQLNDCLNRLTILNAAIEHFRESCGNTDSLICQAENSYSLCLDRRERFETCFVERFPGEFEHMCDDQQAAYEVRKDLCSFNLSQIQEQWAEFTRACGAGALRIRYGSLTRFHIATGEECNPDALPAPSVIVCQ